MTSYLQAEGLTKSFGERVLFENLSLAVGEGQRIGLIAKNGTGKTTLLNILAGKEDYEAGRITRRRDLKIAYLEQDPKLPAGKTVLDACLTGDSPALRAIAAYELALGSGDEESLHRAMAEMDARQAWNYESQVKQILTRLRITDYAQPTEQLSGGQVKRVALAGALIREPELLILDEPTNHLDLETTGWLEDYLSRSRMSLLMVTHDRYFLDRVCTDIVELDDHTTYSYKGNYSLYLEKRQQRLDAADARRERDANLYRKELDWMRRQPQARGTKARSRIESFRELEERLRKRRAETSASTRKQPISVRKYSRSAGYASGSATGSSSTDWTTVSLATRKWASSATTARASRLSSGCCWGWSRPTRERSTSARRSASAIMRNKGSRSTRTRK